MLASLLICAISLVLLVYWLRYTCVLLLRNSNSVSSPTEIARLSYLQIQADLNAEGSLALDPLHDALQQDYAVLSFLVAHAPALSFNPFERRLLAADYRLMRICYRLTRSSAPH